MADAIEQLSSSNYRTIVSDITKVQKLYHLNGWATSLLIQAASQALESGYNERVVMRMFLHTQMGYKCTIARTGDNKKLVLLLATDAQLLEEVQVIAYGKQSKMSVTGAITSINTEELLKSPSGSAASALAGAVTGISTVQTSGQPGADDPQIFVRGTGSSSRTQQPSSSQPGSWSCRP